MNSQSVLRNRERWVKQSKRRAYAKPGRLNKREHERHSGSRIDPKMKLAVCPERLPVITPRIVSGHSLQQAFERLGIFAGQLRCCNPRRRRLERIPDAIDFPELLR